MQSVRLFPELVAFRAISLCGDCWTLQAVHAVQPANTFAPFTFGIDENGAAHMLQRAQVSSKTLQGCGITLVAGASFRCREATVIFDHLSLDCTIIAVKGITATAPDGTALLPEGGNVMCDERRPCGHNDWDDVRTRKGFKTLRCRVCQGRWKVRNTTPRCLAFLHDNCKDLECESIHVRRKKCPLPERADGTPAAAATPSAAAAGTPAMPAAAAKREHRASVTSQSEVVSVASDLPSTEMSECDKAGAREDDEALYCAAAASSTLFAPSSRRESALSWQPADALASSRSDGVPPSDMAMYIPLPPPVPLFDAYYDKESTRVPHSIVSCWLDGDDGSTNQPPALP